MKKAISAFEITLPDTYDILELKSNIEIPCWPALLPQMVGRFGSDAD